MSFECETCGTIEYVLIDGAQIRERMLEGVMFKVSHDEDGNFVVQVAEDSEDYFDDFNQEKLLMEIRECIETEDHVGTQCPHCDRGIVFFEGIPGEEPEQIGPGITLGMSSIDDILDVTENDIIHHREQRPL